MEAFFVSLTTIAVAEIGDRTQLLSLVLATRFRRPVPIIAGILCATLANHAAAASLGYWFGRYLKPHALDFAVGASMVGMALWCLKPDKLDDETGPGRAASAFLTTLTAFFLAEIGDKTQIATVALGAAYSSVIAVVGGTTLGMAAANVPVVLLGKAFADRLPMRSIHAVASALFLVLGLVFMGRAMWR